MSKSKSSKVPGSIKLLAFIGIAVFAYVVGVRSICQGNFWYTDAGVLNDLKNNGHPEVARVLVAENNVLAPSVITVQQEDRRTATYCLDTDVLANHEWVPCEGDK